MVEERKRSPSPPSKKEIAEVPEGKKADL